MGGRSVFVVCRSGFEHVGQTTKNDRLALLRYIIRSWATLAIARLSPALMSASPIPNPIRFCNVSLPIPLDQPFTYALPSTLAHRVQPGCRVLVPFGSRKLSGVVLDVHADRPPGTLREILRLLDEEPVFDADLMKLGGWVSDYYCAPLGETLRAMAPLSGDVRHSKVYSLTRAGRDTTRQLHLSTNEMQGEADDSASLILKLLDGRPLSASYIQQKVKNAAAALRSLTKKGFVEVEDTAQERDPLRASAARLRAEFLARTEAKLPKPERELLAYLELHPGLHNP